MNRLFTSLALFFLLISAGGIQAKELQYRMVDFGLHVPGVPETEVRCLAKNIYFEAGIESGKGKFAVALATLNRVRHKNFPNTVCGVVYQGPRMKNRPRACQFSWACDKKTDQATSRWLWIESRRIAALALRFPEYDITGGATHYHAYYVNPGWAKRLNRTGRIGAHIFYR